METKYIRRELSAVIEEAYRYFSVITVTGSRQSGKTTLIRNLFPRLPYYSLENLDVRSFAENDPVAFLNQHKEGMILDEVHNAPNLLSYIQGMVDDDADRRFILSGSSQFAMLKKVTQSWAGRTAVFELLPMSYFEIREIAADTPLDHLLFNGFYPAIYSGRNVPKFLYPAYMKTYLDKDVRDLLQIKDMMQFHTFIRLCAGRIGSLFKASELANEIRHQLPHGHGVAVRVAGILYRGPAAPVFREHAQTADQNAQALLHGHGACLPSARHRIPGTTCPGQDAGGVVREFRRDGGIETAV